MPTIAGASRYLNAATLANTQGVAAQSPTVFSNSGADTLSLLSSGRRTAVRGFGLSSSARALNQQFIQRSTDINAMFSLGIGADATIEGLQQQILALRARTPTSALARSLIQQDTGEISEGDTGLTVDEEV